MKLAEKISKRMTDKELRRHRGSIEGVVAISFVELIANKDNDQENWLINRLMRELVPEDWNIPSMNYKCLGGFYDNLYFRIEGNKPEKIAWSKEVTLKKFTTKQKTIRCGDKIRCKYNGINGYLTQIDANLIALICKENNGSYNRWVPGVKVNDTFNITAEELTKILGGGLDSWEIRVNKKYVKIPEYLNL